SMALVEGYAHTIEAMRAYYRHLTPSGAVAFVCQSSWLLLRQALTAIEALQAEGLDRNSALDRLVLFSVPPEDYALGPYRHLMLMFRGRPATSRLRELARQAVALDLLPVFVPGVYEPEPLALLRDGNVDIDSFVGRCNAIWRPAAPPLDFRPCSDERPFIADLSWGVPGPLRGFLAGAAALLVGLLLACFAANPGAAPRGSVAPVMLYFVGLGVAFMMVEVVLIHTFTLYLGYPVLSLSTVLFGILLGAALGSLFSQRYEIQKLPHLVAVSTLVICLLCVGLAFLPRAFLQPLFYLGVLLRSGAILLVVAVFGFAMGMPFPSGIRLAVDRLGRGVVPWAWGVNGVASVVGSAGVMALAKVAGFSSALLGGAGVYVAAAGVLGVWWMMRPSARG
ncbi:MAG: hypothetical protein H5T86_11635, partial [Armatimonadetes bacterium]|nr:hypothetical protein [Armatimonadota bacterium]